MLTNLQKFSKRQIGFQIEHYDEIDYRPVHNVQLCKISVYSRLKLYSDRFAQRKASLRNDHESCK